jgi:hypothetical protein
MAIVVAIITMAVLMVIVGVAFDYTSSINRNVQRTNTLESAISIGDGSINILFANWRKICRANGTSSGAPPTTAFSTIPLPTSSPAAFPNIANLSASTTDYYGNGNTPPAGPNISNYRVQALDSDWTVMSPASASPTPAIGQSRGTGSNAMDTTDAAYSYLATVDVTLPSLRGNLVAKVRRIFQKKQESPWNWAIFYVDPLEIHPGPQFTVTGWVHTNSDLYTAHNTLSFADKVTFVDNWYIDFMPGDGYHNETPTSPNWPDGLPPARDVDHEPFGADADTFNFNSGDANPNNDDYHELIEPPNIDKNGNSVSGYSDPLTTQRYYNQADVIVRIDNSNNVRIYQPNGSGGVNQLISGGLYDMFTNAIDTNDSIQDNREQASIRLVTLDIKKLENGSGSNSPTWKNSFGGLVYIFDNSAVYNPSVTNVKRGIRLLNGDAIPNGGLTVVSPNPVYIQGDYNTGKGTPPSNNSTSDPTQPQVSGYTRKPCSVIADAVNILSNNWDDSDSTAGLYSGSRKATNTTINTAIISGIVPTNVYGDGAYSGGAENFPRFLEDWSGGVKLTYYGSMVELYKSRQSRSKWGSANVYDPPTRQWYFDTNFKVNPPPGTLMIVSYVKGRWWVAQ